MNFIRNLIDYFLAESSRPKFNPIALLEMDPNDLLEYVKRYQYIDQGSSRRVYFVSPGKVLKVARNKKGKAQNDAEAFIYDNTNYKDFYTKIYARDPRGMWLLSESAKTPRDEERILDVLQLKDPNNVSEIFYGRLERDNADIKHPFYLAMQEARNRFKLLSGDLHRDHFGITADGRYALFDYGFTEEVSRKHYSGRGDVSQDNDWGTEAKQKRCPHENITIERVSPAVGHYKITCDSCGLRLNKPPPTYMPLCQHTNYNLDTYRGRNLVRDDEDPIYQKLAECIGCNRLFNKYVDDNDNVIDNPCFHKKFTFNKSKQTYDCVDCGKSFPETNGWYDSYNTLCKHRSVKPAEDSYIDHSYYGDSASTKLLCKECGQYFYHVIILKDPSQMHNLTMQDFVKDCRINGANINDAQPTPRSFPLKTPQPPPPKQEFRNKVHSRLQHLPSLGKLKIVKKR